MRNLHNSQISRYKLHQRVHLFHLALHVPPFDTRTVLSSVEGRKTNDVNQYSRTCPPERSATPDCGVHCSTPNIQRRSGRRKYNFTLSTIDPRVDFA